MPRLTCSAILRKCALHGVSSLQVLQMPMMGRPSNSWSGMPWFFIQLRYMKPFLSAVPNHSVERSLRLGVVMVCGEWGGSRESGPLGRAVRQQALQQAENEQQDADDDARPPGTQRAVKRDQGLDDPEHQHAKQRAGYVTHATGEQGAADHHGGDGV